MGSVPAQRPTKRCFGCGSQNAIDHSFCGSCGAPLELKDFIDQQVALCLDESTRERDLVERESAIRIFERAYGWAKMFASIFAVVVAVVVIGFTAVGLSTWADVRNSINSAKQSAIDTVERIKRDVVESSTTARAD